MLHALTTENNAGRGLSRVAMGTASQPAKVRLTAGPCGCGNQTVLRLRRGGSQTPRWLARPSQQRDSRRQDCACGTRSAAADECPACRARHSSAQRDGSSGVQRAIAKREGVSGTNYAFDTFQVTEADLSDPDIVARFSALSRDQLVNYRNQVADPAVQAFIDNLIANLTPVAVPCSQQQASETSKQAEQARQDALPFVKSARLALDRSHGAWINNKADILAGRRTLSGEVACAFNSNFNISPTDPDYGVRHIMVSRRLQLLEGRMSKTVPFACQPSDDPICAPNQNRDTVAYVVNNQPPIHFCQGFDTNPDTLDQ